MYREGVQRAIKERPDFELVGFADNGRTALEEIRTLKPDVAVLDVRMPGLDGPEVLNGIVQSGLPTRVVLLSAHTEPDLVYRAVEAGVGAYLSKEADRSHICDAVAAVARGETVLPPAVQAGLVQQIQARSRDERPALTARELQILHQIAEGHSAPTIGRMLELSPATVKTHLQNLYEKLGVSDRAAAVAEGMRRGILR